MALTVSSKLDWETTRWDWADVQNWQEDQFYGVGSKVWFPNAQQGVGHLCIDSNVATSQNRPNNSASNPWWIPQYISPKPLIDGVEPHHENFEDIRKRLWLLEHLEAGSRQIEDEDRPDYNGWPTTWDPGNGGNTWKEVGELYIWWKGHYWTNFKKMTNIDGRDNRPPDDPHPMHNNDWILRETGANSFFALAPDPNRYHHFDANSGRTYCNSGQRGTAGVDKREWEIDTDANRLYPKQSDPWEIERPIYDISLGIPHLWMRNKRPIDRHHITQPDTLGAIYSAYNYYWKDPPGTATRLHHNVPEDATGNQYAHYGGDPGNNPATITEAQPLWKGGNEYDYNVQWTWDEKFCDAMQNRIERVCCVHNWVWPTWDGDDNSTISEQQQAFQDNWLERNDPDDSTYSGVWDPKTYSAQPWYAYIRSEFWGCNQSGFEFILWLLGEWDWYFDVEYPHMSSTIVDWAIEYGNTGSPPPGMTAAWERYPKAIGTWRRTWKYSFLRHYLPNRRFQYMRDEDYTPTGETWPTLADTPPTGDATWPGLYVGTMPIINPGQSEIDGLNNRHAPIQEGWVREGNEFTSYPEYEIQNEMIIEMREVLAMLQYVSPDLDSLSYRTFDCAWDGGTESKDKLIEHMVHMREMATYKLLESDDVDYFVGEKVLIEIQTKITGIHEVAYEASAVGANYSNKPSDTEIDNAYWARAFHWGADPDNHEVELIDVGGGSGFHTFHMAYYSSMVATAFSHGIIIGMAESILARGEFSVKMKYRPTQGIGPYNVDYCYITVPGVTPRVGPAYFGGTGIKYDYTGWASLMTSDFWPASQVLKSDDTARERKYYLLLEAQPGNHSLNLPNNEGGRGDAGMQFDDHSIVIKLNLNDFPDSVWELDYTNHTDIP